MGEPEPEHPAAFVDAYAPGLGAADFIFVFGTRMRAPALIAAGLFERGLAPWTVVTGGSDRQADGLNEAEQHRHVLLEQGVPADAIIVEDRSSSTHGNVLLAAPLITERVPAPTRAIAVVKWYHRRAVVMLAHRLPMLERIFVVDYEPEDPTTGVVVSRSAWETRRDRVEGEARYLADLFAQGVDPLMSDRAGWRRSIPSGDESSTPLAWHLPGRLKPWSK